MVSEFGGPGFCKDYNDEMGLLKRFLVLALASSAARGLAVPTAAAPPEYPQEDIDSGKALQDMSKLAKETALKRISENPTETCNSDNVRVRKEWCVPSRLPPLVELLMRQADTLLIGGQFRAKKGSNT